MGLETEIKAFDLTWGPTLLRALHAELQFWTVLVSPGVQELLRISCQSQLLSSKLFSIPSD